MQDADTSSVQRHASRFPNLITVPSVLVDELPDVLHCQICHPPCSSKSEVAPTSGYPRHDAPSTTNHSWTGNSSHIALRRVTETAETKQLYARTIRDQDPLVPVTTRNDFVDSVVTTVRQQSSGPISEYRRPLTVQLSEPSPFYPIVIPMGRKPRRGTMMTLLESQARKEYHDLLSSLSATPQSLKPPPPSPPFPLDVDYGSPNPPNPCNSANNDYHEMARTYFQLLMRSRNDMVIIVEQLTRLMRLLVEVEAKDVDQSRIQKLPPGRRDPTGEPSGDSEVAACTCPKAEEVTGELSASCDSGEIEVDDGNELGKKRHRAKKERDIPCPRHPGRAYESERVEGESTKMDDELKACAQAPLNKRRKTMSTPREGDLPVTGGGIEGQQATADSPHTFGGNEIIPFTRASIIAGIKVLQQKLNEIVPPLPPALPICRFIYHVYLLAASASCLPISHREFVALARSTHTLRHTTPLIVQLPHLLKQNQTLSVSRPLTSQFSSYPSCTHLQEIHPHLPFSWRRFAPLSILPLHLLPIASILIHPRFQLARRRLLVAAYHDAIKQVRTVRAPPILLYRLEAAEAEPIGSGIPAPLLAQCAHMGGISVILLRSLRALSALGISHIPTLYALRLVSYELDNKYATFLVYVPDAAAPISYECERSVRARLALWTCGCPCTSKVDKGESFCVTQDTLPLPMNFGEEEAGDDNYQAINTMRSKAGKRHARTEEDDKEETETEGWLPPGEKRGKVADSCMGGENVHLVDSATHDPSTPYGNHEQGQTADGHVSLENGSHDEKEGFDARMEPKNNNESSEARKASGPTVTEDRPGGSGRSSDPRFSSVLAGADDEVAISQELMRLCHEEILRSGWQENAHNEVERKWSGSRTRLETASEARLRQYTLSHMLNLTKEREIDGTKDVHLSTSSSTTTDHHEAVEPELENPADTSNTRTVPGQRRGSRYRNLSGASAQPERVERVREPQESADILSSSMEAFVLETPRHIDAIITHRLLDIFHQCLRSHCCSHRLGTWVLDKYNANLRPTRSRLTREGMLGWLDELSRDNLALTSRAHINDEATLTVYPIPNGVRLRKDGYVIANPYKHATTALKRAITKALPVLGTAPLRYATVQPSENGVTDIDESVFAPITLPSLLPGPQSSTSQAGSSCPQPRSLYSPSHSVARVMLDPLALPTEAQPFVLSTNTNTSACANVDSDYELPLPHRETRSSSCDPGSAVSCKHVNCTNHSAAVLSSSSPSSPSSPLSSSSASSPHSSPMSPALPPASCSCIGTTPHGSSRPCSNSPTKANRTTTSDHDNTTMTDTNDPTTISDEPPLILPIPRLYTSPTSLPAPNFSHPIHPMPSGLPALSGHLRSVRSFFKRLWVFQIFLSMARSHNLDTPFIFSLRSSELAVGAYLPEPARSVMAMYMARGSLSDAVRLEQQRSVLKALVDALAPVSRKPKPDYVSQTPTDITTSTTQSARGGITRRNEGDATDEKSSHEADLCEGNTFTEENIELFKSVFSSFHTNWRHPCTSGYLPVYPCSIGTPHALPTTFLSLVRMNEYMFLQQHRSGTWRYSAPETVLGAGVPTLIRDKAYSVLALEARRRRDKIINTTVGPSTSSLSSSSCSPSSSDRKSYREWDYFAGDHESKGTSQKLHQPFPSHMTSCQNRRFKLGRVNPSDVEEDAAIAQATAKNPCPSLSTSASYATGCFVWDVLDEPLSTLDEEHRMFPVQYDLVFAMRILFFLFRVQGTPNEASWPGVTSLPVFQRDWPQWNAFKSAIRPEFVATPLSPTTSSSGTPPNLQPRSPSTTQQQSSVSGSTAKQTMPDPRTGGIETIPNTSFHPDPQTNNDTSASLPWVDEDAAIFLPDGRVGFRNGFIPVSVPNDVGINAVDTDPDGLSQDPIAHDLIVSLTPVSPHSRLPLPLALRHRFFRPIVDFINYCQRMLGDLADVPADSLAAMEGARLAQSINVDAFVELVDEDIDRVLQAKSKGQSGPAVMWCLPGHEYPLPQPKTETNARPLSSMTEGPSDLLSRSLSQPRAIDRIHSGTPSVTTTSSPSTPSTTLAPDRSLPTISPSPPAPPAPPSPPQCAMHQPTHNVPPSPSPPPCSRGMPPYLLTLANPYASIRWGLLPKRPCPQRQSQCSSTVPISPMPPLLPFPQAYTYAFPPATNDSTKTTQNRLHPLPPQPLPTAHLGAYVFTSPLSGPMFTHTWSLEQGVTSALSPEEIEIQQVLQHDDALIAPDGTVVPPALHRRAFCQDHGHLTDLLTKTLPSESTSRIPLSSSSPSMLTIASLRLPFVPVCGLLQSLRMLCNDDLHPPLSYHHLSRTNTITPIMRMLLVDWLTELVADYSLIPQNLHLAITMLDRAVASDPSIAPSNYQLLGQVALLITTKVVSSASSRVLALNFVASCSKNIYSEATFAQAELALSRSQPVPNDAPTALKYLNHFLQLMWAPPETAVLAMYLADLSLQAPNATSFPAHTTALVCATLALWGRPPKPCEPPVCSSLMCALPPIESHEVESWRAQMDLLYAIIYSLWTATTFPPEPAAAEFHPRSSNPGLKPVLAPIFDNRGVPLGTLVPVGVELVHEDDVDWSYSIHSGIDESDPLSNESDDTFTKLSHTRLAHPLKETFVDPLCCPYHSLRLRRAKPDPSLHFVPYPFPGFCRPLSEVTLSSSSTLSPQSQGGDSSAPRESCENARSGKFVWAYPKTRLEKTSVESATFHSARKEKAKALFGKYKSLTDQPVYDLTPEIVRNRRNKHEYAIQLAYRKSVQSGESSALPREWQRYAYWKTHTNEHVCDEGAPYSEELLRKNGASKVVRMWRRPLWPGGPLVETCLHANRARYIRAIYKDRWRLTQVQEAPISPSSGQRSNHDVGSVKGSTATHDMESPTLSGISPTTAPPNQLGECRDDSELQAYVTDNGPIDEMSPRREKRAVDIMSMTFDALQLNETRSNEVSRPDTTSSGDLPTVTTDVERIAEGNSVATNVRENEIADSTPNDATEDQVNGDEYMSTISSYEPSTIMKRIEWIRQRICTGEGDCQCGPLAQQYYEELFPTSTSLSPSSPLLWEDNHQGFETNTPCGIWHDRVPDLPLITQFGSRTFYPPLLTSSRFGSWLVSQADRADPSFSLTSDICRRITSFLSVQEKCVVSVLSSRWYAIASDPLQWQDVDLGALVPRTLSTREMIAIALRLSRCRSLSLYNFAVSRPTLSLMLWVAGDTLLKLDLNCAEDAAFRDPHSITTELEIDTNERSESESKNDNSRRYSLGIPSDAVDAFDLAINCAKTLTSVRTKAFHVLSCLSPFHSGSTDLSSSPASYDLQNLPSLLTSSKPITPSSSSLQHAALGSASHDRYNRFRTAFAKAGTAGLCLALTQALLFPPGLQVLDAQRCNVLIEPDIISAMQSCTQLKSLLLGSCSWLTSKGVEAIVKAACIPHLESLDLAKCTSLRDLHLIAIALRARSLRSLNLDMCEELTDESISTVAQLCPKLQEIGLSAINISGKSIVALAHHCPDLQRIDISFCQNVSSRSLEFLASSARDLRQVTACLVPGFDDNVLRTLTVHAKELRHLNIRNCPVTDDSVIPLVNINNNLTHLHVGGCPLTHETITRIRQLCPTLAIVSDG